MGMKKINNVCSINEEAFKKDIVDRVSMLIDNAITIIDCNEDEKAGRIIKYLSKADKQDIDSMIELSLTYLVLDKIENWEVPK